MDFNVKVYAVLNIFGIEVWLTKTIVATWIIMAALIVLAVITRVRLKKFKQAPSGFQNVMELIVEMFDNFVKNSAGEKLMYLGNWYFTVFAFVLLSNISGIFYGMRPPTADWAVTFALAMATFGLIQYAGLRYQRGKYIKTFFEPSPLFFPLNLMGELARPISLSFRLFGNILAGMILMSLLYGMAPVFLKFLIPSFLHAYFDLFSGVIQTYIFCVLSLSFIGAAAAVAEE